MNTIRNKDNIKNQLIDFAEENAEKEICGFILYEKGDFVFAESRNYSMREEEAFEIHPADFLLKKLTGNLVAIFHSHPVGQGDSTPSSYDMITSRECLYPYLIYSCESKTFNFFYEDHFEPEISVIKELEGVING